VVYIIVLAANSSFAAGQSAFYISIAITAATLFLMGIVKGKLTGSHVLKSAFTTAGFGAVTAFVGWFAGWILGYFFPGVNVSG